MSMFDDIIKQKQKAWNAPELMNPSSRGDKIPFSSPLMNWATYGGIPRDKITEFFGQPGGGKAQPLYSKILTPHGFVAMGDIKVGDSVFDGNGNVCKVTQIFPQGKRPIFEITTQANNKIRVADNHLNSVWWYNQEKGQREDFVWDTLTLIQKFKQYGHWRRIRVDLPEVDFDFQEVPIDPYLLGCLIGDGSLHDNFEFSNSEQDIVEKVNQKLDKYHYELCNYTGDGVSWGIRRQKAFYTPGKKTYLRKIIEDLKLNVKSVDKYIPDEYLYNSYEVRLALLQGLFDTDGSIFSDGSVEFSTSSVRLSENFAFLVRSFGIRDLIRTSVGKYIDNDGNDIKCNISYSHQLKIPNGFPFYTSKKHSLRYKDRQNPPLRNIISIEYIGEEECQCIMVDSPAHTYISDDFIPTHNTTTAVDVCKNATYMFEKEWEARLIELREKNTKEAKLELAELEDSGPRKVLYLDLEHSFDTEWAQTLGIDSSKIAIMQPPDIPAEEILQMVQEMIESNEVGLIVLDSIPSLVPKSVLEKKIGERTVASLAGLLDVFMKKVNQLLMRYHTTLLLINQIRDNMDNPYVVNTPGGQAVKFFCCLRIQFSLGNPIDIVGNELPQKTEDPAGYLIKIRIVKQKSAPNDRKNASYYLLSQSGIKPEMDYAQLAIKKYGVIRKAGAWFSLAIPDTGEVLEEDGKPVKINGLPKVYEYLETHPDYFESLKTYIENDINGE